MTTGDSTTRTVVPLMSLTVLVALLGHLVDAQSPAPKTRTGKVPEVGDAQILLGGIAATVLLTLVSMAGDVGEKLSKGLAVTALLASIGYYGVPLFNDLDKLTGAVKPAPVKPKTTTTGAKP